MNKQESGKTRYYVQWDTHARHMCTVMCSLMEHQSLVDLAICCGTNTIHAHKCILAANSPYFREQLEKNAGTEQVVITGLDFTVVKSIIEFMYCGETNIVDENLKYMIAAAKFFQMRGLQTLVSDHQDIRFEADSIHIPPPIFLPKKPKYPNAYRPLNNTIPPTNFNTFKSAVSNEPYLHRKVKRKFVRSEAEKACAKEAAASRLALEALQKELANTSQMSSFVIEESCTETTVENFIPHSDETFIENLNHIENVPLQVVNYDLNNSLLTASQVINIEKPECTNNVIQYGIEANSTKDKLKRMLGTDIPGNVEIMFRTSEGSFVNVTDDVLQNLSGGTLQYQIVDENGQVGEIRELQVQEQNNSTNFEECKNNPLLDSSLTQHCSEAEPFSSTPENRLITCTNLELPNLQENTDNQNDVINSSLEIVNESHIISLCNEESGGNQNPDITNSTNIDDDLGNTTSSSSSTSSPGKTSNNSSSSESKIDESDPFIEALNKSPEINQDSDSVAFNSCDIDQFLNLNHTIEEDKENIYMINEQAADSHFNDSNKKIFSKIVDNQNLKCNNSLESDSEESKSLNNDTNMKNTQEWKPDDVLSMGLGNSPQDEKGNDEEHKTSVKRIKISQPSKPMTDNQDPWQILEYTQNTDSYSPRKTRSSLKSNEDDTFAINISQSCETVEDNLVYNVKYDKPRRIMPNRKKKLN